MDDALGPVAYADAPAPRFLGEEIPAVRADRTSPETAKRIDDAVRGLLQGAYDTAVAIRENRTVLDRCAQALVERETLIESELQVLAADLWLHSGGIRAGAAVSYRTTAASPAVNAAPNAVADGRRLPD